MNTRKVKPNRALSIPKTISIFFEGTATPLASIFGSGFLVIIGVLNGAVGQFSVFAMVGICGLAFCVGGVIRFNIANVESAREMGTAKVISIWLDRLADVALVPAYIISVTLYLRILSSYGLGYLSIDTELNERKVTTGIILFILFIGLSKGLKILEGLERWALYGTFGIVALLIGAFAFQDLTILASGNIQLVSVSAANPWHTIAILGGSLIVVQGFETTRYLGDEYDAETRIRASRNSQIISSVVYVLFVTLATPLAHILANGVSDNALIILAGSISVWLTGPLVVAAIFSQFSAATADTIGASGNLSEISKGRIPKRLTYAFICGFAIILTWLADTMSILALASRAFAFYYFVQCLVAVSVSKSIGRNLLLSGLATVLLLITVFAIPAG